MKKILSLLSCIVVSCAFSQNNFIVSVGTPGNDGLYSAIEVAGGYVATGYVDQVIIPVYKVDQDGRSVSNAVILPGNPDAGGTAIINTNDGGFAITAVVGYETAIFKFDSTGVLRWTKQYGEGIRTIGETFLQMDDKGFLIAGATGDVYRSGYLIKIDSVGNLKWSKNFINAGAFHGLQKTKDQNYILLSGDSYDTDSSISVIKVDTAGNILWTKSFISSAKEVLEGSGILAVSDGGYLISEYHNIFKLDSQGNMQWSKLVDAGENNFAELYDAIETANGSYVLAGRHELGYYLMKIDNMGTVLWTKIFSGSGDYFYASIRKLMATSDRGYLGAGIVNGDCVFLKFDSVFNTCTSTLRMGALQNFDVSYKSKTISTTAGNAVTSNNLFSTVHYGSVTNTCSVLPVNLWAFNIMQQNGNVLLNWQTASEQNSAFFVVERSNNGKNFKEIGRVNSKINLNKVQRYSFEDTNPFNGDNYYRLRQVDADSKITYSKIVFIDFNKRVAMKLYPNPAKDILMLQGLNANMKATISIIGLEGGILARVIASGSTFTWNIKQLQPGTYFVRVESDKNVSILKFVKNE